jgi:hypothetical protein
LGIFFGGLVLVCGNVWKILRERRAKRNEEEKSDEDDV